MTPPPEHLNLDEGAIACWYRVQSRLLAMGKWEHEYVLGLPLVAEQCADYLAFAREVRALKDVDPEAMKDLEKALEETRRLARECLADFLMIPRNRVPLAVMNAEGLDAEIVALCAPWVN